MTPKLDTDQYSEDETKRRMEDAIRKAQKTPPVPRTAKKKPSPKKRKGKSR